MSDDKINFDQPEERFLKPGSIEQEDLDPNMFPFDAFTFTDPGSTTGTVVLSTTENWKFINDPIDSMSDADTLIIWDDSTDRHRTATHLQVTPRTIYNAPTSLTITAGDDDNSATVAKAVTMHDGQFVQIEEVTGTPGYDFSFTFTNVTTTPTHIIGMLWYQGSATHTCTVRLWDYTNSDWDVFLTHVDTKWFTTFMLPIPDDISDDYISGGEMKVQFYHDSGGNASHVVYVDYVSLVHYAGRPPA